MTSIERTKLKIGTRGSLLARTQTELVVNQLREFYPDLEIETQLIRTSGDRQLREVVGAFVKELQEALLQKEINLAVHSLKDLPTDIVPGLIIAATPEREDPREAIISKLGKLSDLKPGMRLGTGSLRRTAQLAKLRPDLLYLPLIGNVDTRLRKLEAGQYQAIVMAVAGLNRLALTKQFLQLGSGVENDSNEFLYMEILDPGVMLPAPGQGALALECRKDDQETVELLRPLNHFPTYQAVQAERAFLQALGGGCSVPIAAYGQLTENGLVLDGLVASPEGSKVLHEQITGLPEEAEKLGTKLAEILIGRGAKELLQEVNR